MSVKDNLIAFKEQLPDNVTLVAVSKTKPLPDLQEAIDAGQLILGENKIQELVGKHEALSKDVEWHMIGHVQTNKVKYIAPFVSLIHAVDSLKLLKEINKQALKHERVINCLLQIKIASEDSKFGLGKTDALQLLESKDFKALTNVQISGLMGMATFTEDEDQVRSEFKGLSDFMHQLQTGVLAGNHDFKILSMGMTNDFRIAIEEGSNMIRVGSAIFGARS